MGSHRTTVTATTQDRQTQAARPAGPEQPGVSPQDRRKVQRHPENRCLRRQSTVYHWLKRWSEEGVLETVWQKLLSLLEAQGDLDLSEGSLDGSFVVAKRGAKR